MRPNVFFKHLIDPIFSHTRTRQIYHVNPTLPPERDEPAKDEKFAVYDYNGEVITDKHLETPEELLIYLNNNKITRINIDGLKKKRDRRYMQEDGHTHAYCLRIS